jgi:aminoglycoside/choline kinase family phosphotransferase
MLRFSSAKFMWVLDFFLEHYLHSYLGRTPDPTQLKAYRRCLNPLCDALEAMPPVLTHRDYHARNLMFFQDKLALIDYQDARPGPRTYDLVSLLLDPYAPTDRLDRNSLIEGYCNQRQVVLTDAFWLEWDQVATQRLLKAAGSFAFLVGVRKRREYEPYLRPTLERACACMRRLQNLEPIIELVDQTLDFIKA